MSSDTQAPGKGRKRTVAERWRLLQLAAADAAELIPAWVASLWMTRFLYRIHAGEDAMGKGDQAETGSASRRSPWHLYAACFVFCCSAASFLQRRKASDGIQLYVFAILVGAGLIVGQLLGASTESIMLLYVSWAICVAMVVSAATDHLRRLG